MRYTALYCVVLYAPTPNLYLFKKLLTGVGTNELTLFCLVI